MSDTEQGENTPGLRVSRRGVLMGGALGLAAAVGVAEGDPQLALAAQTIPTSTVPLPATTAPEQLRLAWGSDPTSEVTVAWSSPGSTPMPAPTLAYATSPITPTNPGSVVALPTPVPLSLSAPRTEPSATSFQDGLSLETTYHYHVPLTGLNADTEYYYEVRDGAAAPSTASGQFQTAPSGRAAYRFTAFGDIGTPYTGNPSGDIWTESSDTSIYTLDGVIAPGDGKGPGLFHLMLADLAYGNVNPANAPNIWRDYQYNASRAAQNQPWMAIQGNHEVEFGGTDVHGNPVAAASRTTSEWYNGPYGAGNFLARHLLPDNGLINWDGNSLQGSFYSFQVGTVLFVCLNTNDVVYQNPQLSSAASGSKDYAGAYTGGTLPQAATVGQYQTTGLFTAGGTGVQLVPDTASGTPNLQTQWLESTLAAARADGSDVDMIVVCEHHCALSTGPNNGVDLAIRAAWLPLYDQYEVDLVIGGHDHDYERSYPVRGYTAPAGTTTAAFTNPWGTYTSGETIDTRTPNVVATVPTTLSSGQEAWNTAGGTVFLQLGGAGAAAGSTPKTTSSGERLAEIWATDQGVVVSGTASQCATEVADWSANYDSSDNYGYAVFDVSPGSGPGETTLTYQWFQVPTVANGGSATAQTTPYEEFVFTRLMPDGEVTISGAANGSVPDGSPLTAVPSGWPGNATYAYQWYRGTDAITGATGSSYTTGSADVGAQITVAVTVTAQSYPSASVTSSAVSVTGGATTTTGTTTTGTTTTPATTTSTAGASAGATATATATAGTTPLTINTPKIAGTARVGGELTASGVIASEFYATISYQWLRDGTAIKGATAATYKPVAADAGQSVRVKATAVAAGQTVSVESAAVTISGEAFKRISKPKIIGTALVGHTVSAEIASWFPEAHFAYQWLLGGRAITGATHPTLKLESSYAGKQVTVRVTGSRSGYRSDEVVSPAVVVSRRALSAVRPQISGKALVGETVHAHIGQWPAGTEFGYRWFVNGRVIPGATGHAFRVESAYRGQRIWVEVTGRLAGHGAVSAVSAPTRAVRRPWTLL